MEGLGCSADNGTNTGRKNTKQGIGFHIYELIVFASIGIL
jgi:hypothetical protein